MAGMLKQERLCNHSQFRVLFRGGEFMRGKQSELPQGWHIARHIDY